MRSSRRSLLAVALFDRRHRRDGDHLVVGRHTHDDHALRLPADPRDGSDLRAQDHTARADDQHLLLGNADHSHRGQLTDPVGHLESEHALAGAVVHGVLRDRRALAVTALSDDETLAVGRCRRGADDGIALAQLDADHALRVATHRADFLFAESNRLAERGGDEDLIGASGGRHPVELVGLLQVDGDEAVAAHVRVLGERRLLYISVPGRHQHVVRLGLRLRANEDGADALVGPDIDEVVDRHALRLPLALRHFVHTQLKHASALCEEQHRRVGVRDEQVLRVILLTGAAGRFATCGRTRTLQAHATALLGAEDAQRLALHVTPVGEGHHDLFLRDEVLGRQLVRLLVSDLGAAVVAVLLDDIVHLFLDEHADLLVAGEDALEVGDGLDDLLVLLVDLAALELGEAAEGEGEHCPRLPLGQPEPALQLGRGDLGVARGANGLDHLVQVVEADLETLEDVGALLGFFEVETSAAQDDVAPVVDEELQGLLQAQHDRATLDDGEHDHAEYLLQGGVLVQVVEHREDLGLALELDDHAHALAVGFVAQVRDPLELSLRDELGDLGHQRRLVHGVGKLVDDDPLASVGRLLEGVAGTDDDAAVAGRIRGLDPGRAHDQAAGGEVWTLDEREEIFAGGFRVVDQVLDAARDLAQVVRRNVGGHADRDAGRAVHEQVR